MGFGTAELLIIAFIVTVLFGAKKVPQLMRGMGEAVRDFREGTREVEAEIKETEKALKS